MNYLIARDYQTKHGFAYELLHHVHQMTFLQSPREIDSAKYRYGFKSVKAALHRVKNCPGSIRGLYLLGPDNKKQKITKGFINATLSKKK